MSADQAHVALLPGVGVPVVFGSGLVMRERSVNLESITLVDEEGKGEEKSAASGADQSESNGEGQVRLQDVVAVEEHLEVLVIKTRLLFGSLDMVVPLSRSICRLDIEAPADVSGEIYFPP